MIKLQNLSFAYENTNETVGQLRNIDLHVEKGELIILSGKSGCGKTTLLKIIMGDLSAKQRLPASSMGFVPPFTLGSWRAATLLMAKMR